MTGLMRTSTTKAITAVSRPPTKSINPVPIRLRTPSTSVMMRETSVPTLVESKYLRGSRPTCSCTWLRSSAISRCAALERVWVRAKEVTPCTRVATSTAPTSGISRCARCLPITSSTRNFVDAGSTSAVSRLITMRTKPRASRARRGRIRSHTSGRALKTEIGGPLWGSDLLIKCTSVLYSLRSTSGWGGGGVKQKARRSGPLFTFGGGYRAETVLASLACGVSPAEASAVGASVVGASALGASRAGASAVGATAAGASTGG